MTDPHMHETHGHKTSSENVRKEKEGKPGMNPPPIRHTFLLSVCSDACVVSVSHNFEGHVHESHGHKTATSSEHGGEKEEEEEHRKRKAEKRGRVCSRYMHTGDDSPGCSKYAVHKRSPCLKVGRPQ